MAASRSELEEDDAAQHLAWAREHEHLGAEDWLSWVWSDEMYVRRMAGASRGQTWVFRPGRRTPAKWKVVQDKYMPNRIYKRAKTSKEKVSVHMWSLFSGRKIGPLVRLHGDPGAKRKGALSLKYLRLLKKWLPDMIRRFPYGSTVYFVQDGAGIHRGTVVKNWWMQAEERGISDRRIKLVKWPPYSPDLNPIECAWARVKSLFEKEYPDMLNSQYRGWALRKQISDAVEHCWELLDSDFFDSLARSMPERIKAVIEADGWYTKY